MDKNGKNREETSWKIFLNEFEKKVDEERDILLRKIRDKIKELDDVRKAGTGRSYEEKKKIRELESKNKKLIIELKKKLNNISDPSAQMRIKSHLDEYASEESKKEMKEKLDEFAKKSTEGIEILMKKVEGYLEDLK